MSSAKVGGHSPQQSISDPDQDDIPTLAAQRQRGARTSQAFSGSGVSTYDYLGTQERQSRYITIGLAAIAAVFLLVSTLLIISPSTKTSGYNYQANVDAITVTTTATYLASNVSPTASSIVPTATSIPQPTSTLVPTATALPTATPDNSGAIASANATAAAQQTATAQQSAQQTATATSLNATATVVSIQQTALAEGAKAATATAQALAKTATAIVQSTETAVAATSTAQAIATQTAIANATATAQAQATQNAIAAATATQTAFAPAVTVSFNVNGGTAQSTSGNFCFSPGGAGGCYSSNHVDYTVPNQNIRFYYEGETSYQSASTCATMVQNATNLAYGDVQQNFPYPSGTLYYGIALSTARTSCIATLTSYGNSPPSPIKNFDPAGGQQDNPFGVYPNNIYPWWLRGYALGRGIADSYDPNTMNGRKPGNPSLPGANEKFVNGSSVSCANNESRNGETDSFRWDCSQPWVYDYSLGSQLYSSLFNCVNQGQNVGDVQGKCMDRMYMSSFSITAPQGGSVIVPGKTTITIVPNNQ